MAASKTILICDDDQGMRDTLAAILKRDYRVIAVPSGEAALGVLKDQDVDLILLDVRLPGISGFDVLRIVKENYSLVECIMISAINEVETAVQAMKHGAYHYITKNFDYDELRSLVRNACERQDLNRQVITLSAQVAEQSEREFLIGPSAQIRDIIDLVHKVAKLSATVLILGESGTGKELLARLLHRESGRGDAPFIAVNLSAIPHELVESTLFGHEDDEVQHWPLFTPAEKRAVWRRITMDATAWRFNRYAERARLASGEDHPDPASLAPASPRSAA